MLRIFILLVVAGCLGVFFGRSQEKCLAAPAAGPSSRPVPLGISDAEALTPSRLLQRARILNRQREIIVARLKEIESALRNTSIALNINGVGTPGRLNAKELELSELIHRQLELKEKANDLTAERNFLAKSPKEGAMTMSVQQAVESDATIIALRKAIGEVEVKLAEATASGATVAPLQSQRDALREALDRQLAKMREEKTAMRLADLKLQSAQIQSSLDAMMKRTDALKEDLGAYSTQMMTYTARQDEKKTLVDRLAKVDDELELLVTVEQLREEQATTQPSL